MIKLLILLLISVFTIPTILEVEAIPLSSIINVGAITNNSDIDNNLKLLDINPEDYKIYPPTDENLKWKNDTYMVAIGENRISQSKIDVYFYTYYPIEKKNDEIHSLSFNVKINQIPYQLHYNDGDGYKPTGSTEIKYISESNDKTISKNITKYKFTLTYVSNDKRNYIIDSIYNNFNKKKSELTFEATCIENYGSGQVSTEINFNSFVFITNDELKVIQIPQSQYKNIDGSLKPLIDRIGSIIDNLLSGITGVKTFFDINLFFYHFDTPRKIDNILEVEFISDRYTHYTDMYNNKKINFQKEKVETIYSGLQTYTIKGDTISLDRFTTPQKRKKEFQNITSHYSHIESSSGVSSSIDDFYNNFKHSLLLGAGTTKTEKYTSPPIGMFPPIVAYKIWNDMMENVQLKRMKFEADGKIYNSYVADDPDNSTGTIIITPSNPDFFPFPELINFFNEITEWISKNWLVILIILGALFIIIPLISIFGFKIITIIIKFIFKLLKNFIKLIISPFLLIKKKCGNMKLKKIEKTRTKIDKEILDCVSTNRNN